MSGIFASDGSWEVNVVAGSSYTGLFGTNGAINVISSPGNVYVGTYHPCGALYVTDCTQGQLTIYAKDGSLNVSVSPYQSGTQKVTVVSGSFGNTGLYYYYLGF